MKDLSAAMLAHLTQHTTTLAEAWRVERTDGRVYGFTSHDVSFTLEGVDYIAAPGLQATAAHSTDTLSVDTLDVTIFLSISDEADITAGIWDNAIVTVFQYNWDDLPMTFGNDLLILRHGNLGEVKRKTNMLNAEIRGLTQRLSRRIGRQYLPTCPWRHAQWSVSGGTFVSSLECGVSLAGRIDTSTISSLGSDPMMVFSDSASTRADNYFKDGLIHFTSGANDGLTREIASFLSKEYKLHRPLPYAVQIGDAYKAVIGDNKTWEVCKDIFANQLNFGGFPHLPGIAKVWANPTGA